MKRKIGIIVTIIATSIILIFCLLLLEVLFLYDDHICHFTYQPTIISRIIGYILLIVSISLWQTRKRSKWWIALALFIFGIVVYGNNGYRISALFGGCGNSLYKTTFFTIKTELGDFATNWKIEVDSLETGNFDGKLLGYSVNRQKLTLYRIGEKPLKVRTGFLLWRTSPRNFVNTLSPRLHSFRNLEFEKNNIGYEFIGGRDMPLEVFLNEIMFEGSEFAGKKLKNKQIINEADGTTRFRFEIE